MMAMVRGDIHVLVVLLVDCVCVMEMYVSMIWSFSHACVLLSVGSCSLCRSAVLMSCWLREVVKGCGFFLSAARMCGMDGCIVGMERIVGGIGIVLGWECCVT